MYDGIKCSVCTVCFYLYRHGLILRKPGVHFCRFWMSDPVCTYVGFGFEVVSWRMIRLLGETELGSAEEQPNKG